MPIKFLPACRQVWAEVGCALSRHIRDQKGPFISFIIMLGWKLTGSSCHHLHPNVLLLVTVMWFLWLIINAMNDPVLTVL